MASGAKTKNKITKLKKKNTKNRAVFDELVKVCLGPDFPGPCMSFYREWKDIKDIEERG